MKKFILTLFLIIPFSLPTHLFAQTDRELLLELIKQQAELTKQVAELSKQQAITATKVDSLEKSSEKRFDAQSNLTMGMIGFLAVLVGVLIWDRPAANSPLEKRTTELTIESLELKKEVALLKEKELKLEKRLLKNENNFKRIVEIDPRFANIS